MLSQKLVDKMAGRGYVTQAAAARAVGYTRVGIHQIVRRHPVAFKDATVRIGGARFVRWVVLRRYLGERDDLPLSATPIARAEGPPLVGALPQRHRIEAPVAATPQGAVGLGEVLQGDCLEFLRGLPDASVDLLLTDPAYSGMNQHLMLGRGRIVGRYGGAGQPGERWFREFQDDPDTFRAFLRECRRVLRDDRHLYLMFDSYSLLSLAPLVREEFAVKNVIVWDKLLLGMGHYFRRRHELILFASKGRRPLRRRDFPDIWRFKRLTRAPYPTQKPVELFETMIAASAEPGFLVVDPFVGSGSSAVAALKQGCRFAGCDISAEAIALARTRVAAVAAGRADPLQPQSALPDQREKRRRSAATKSTTSGVRSAAAVDR